MGYFNSREYEWNDLQVVVAGRLVTRIRALEYNKKKEKEVLYAKGGKGHAIQSGNTTVDGKITLLQSEVIAMDKASSTGDLLDMTFDIVASYGNPANGDVITTDLIKTVGITEKPKSLKQNDKYMEIELPFIALDVKENYI